VLGAKSGSIVASPPRAAIPKGDSEAEPGGVVSKMPTNGPQVESPILENIAPLMNSQQCISHIEACMAGKTLSGAVAEVLMLASRPSAELKDLSALITRDPVLSVRVLQMANSAAFFSRRGSVTTITDAVKNIGATNVRNIAASVGVFDAMPASSPDGFNPIRCWQHSFAVARLCEAFVLPTAPAEAGVAYLVGLCHDLGEIMFRTQFEQEYKSVLNEQKRTGAALEQIEQRLLGMTHTDILKVILKCMGLPESIRNPIERFQKSSKTATGQPLVSRALAVAEFYANGLLLVSSESSLISPVTEKDWAALSGQGKLAIPDGEEIRSQVYCLTAILSRMNSADQAALMKSPYKKSTAVIWLARDPLFSNADPLAAALAELANVEVHDCLPTPEQASNLSALAIEGRGRNVPGWSLPDIENSRKANSQLPLLWLTNETTAAPGDQAVEPLQVVSLRAIQAFIEQNVPATLRAAA
jgi:HD-like signal output (HDOD) protein